MNRGHIEAPQLQKRLGGTNSATLQHHAPSLREVGRMAELFECTRQESFPDQRIG
ncbi:MULTISPECIES: hypothetical protein [Paenibacillus]|uniref:hypothetical protein n=1 Tax=Paenibacillus TaxID=44249 RepID=UPI0022B919E1|nr:hypothetical protein [Paenibacillus caseinilyticus]